MNHRQQLIAMYVMMMGKDTQPWSATKEETPCKPLSQQTSSNKKIQPTNY